jgi:ATP-dependent Clp protease protease subunit
MKRVLVLLLGLFTFLAAPQIPTLRTASAAVVAATVNGPDPDIMKILEALEKKDEVEVSCESMDGNDKCVPSYRFNEEVDESSAGRAIRWIQAANEAGADELMIEINTPGGSVPDGFELARAIENSEAPVTCVVDGDAASMGFYLLQSCDYRAMTKRSKLMAHEPALGGSFRGQPNQWEAIAQMMKAERDALAEHCNHRLNITLQRYHELTDGGKMWWLLHEEAKKVAAVDEVVKSVRSMHEKMLHSATKAPKQP